MQMAIRKIAGVLLAAVFICSMCFTTVFADELRAGTVAGLPEKLVVLDDAGRSVSKNGEYFFEVDGMKAREVYTKKIQIMNLREDAAYHIFFNAQRISTTGEINLEEECECTVYLDDNVIYKGKITGEGEPDIRQTPLSVGYYHPGESRVMKVDIVWPDNVDHGEFEVDNGARIVDSNGTTIVREQTGKSHIEGETVFKWIFTAVIDLDPPHPQSGPDNPSDSVKTGETITFIAAVVMAVALTFMILFVVTKKKKEKEKTAKSAVSAENTETVVRSRIDDKPKNENDKE